MLAGGIPHELCCIPLGGEAVVRVPERHSADFWLQEAVLPHHLRPARWAALIYIRS